MDFEITPAQRDLKERAREVGLRWRGQHEQWDLDDASPYAEIAQSLADADLLGLTMPTKYGGKDGTALDYVVVVEELFISSQSWLLGEPPFCTTGPGPSMIMLAENEATKEKFLPDVISGRKGCAIALTEPDHGSDLTDLDTVAVREGDEYVITGTKRFITGAPENELYAVFARFDDIPGARGVGCILVEKGTPGLELARGAHFVGSRGLPHGELHLTECRVPIENLVSGAGSFGRLMTAFNMERLHNSIYSLAFGRVAYELTLEYCRTRRSFDKEIIEFQSTYHSLADMHVALEGQRLLTHHAAVTAIDGKFPRPLESTVSKLNGAAMLPDLTQKCLLLHGGDGVTLDYPIQRIHRDAIAAMVAGGSPPVLRNAIASQLYTERRFRQ